MKIAIIGAGNVGSSLAKGWALKGHEVVFGVRNTNSEKTKKALALHSSLRAISIKDAISESEVVLLATPAGEVKEIAQEIKPFLKNQIILDSMNSVSAKPEGFQNTFEALKAYTEYEHIVKCFNSTRAENMANPNYPDGAVDMFMAGSSKKGKEIARILALDVGFKECYDFGGDDKVPLLENLALCWINLAYMQGQGRNFAFKIVKR